MKRYKYFKNIPENLKEEVIRLFTTMNNNTVPAIISKLEHRLSAGHVNRLINEYLKR